ncbi:DsbA family protein [Pontibacter silvestris]|uniref:DsbA family protein n=1 Tax=Pontibacter silvestris TaxID=2305183 RepID=A0ABW4WUK3_9BACT|nr:DsbA family protein [Pontibacter silvestris]MCC9137833.1 DsbA family protein [Pontibacter silvestris]
MIQAPQSPTLLYITNPMCAWCYGFTHVVRRLRALWHGRLNVRVLCGGLNAYATEPLHQEEKEHLAISWHRVQERANVPFDYRFFIKKNFVFNTEPVCRALLCVKLLRPVLTLEVLRALHSAFFADGVDVTDSAVLVRVVGLFGISENLFLTLFESEEIMQQMEDEFTYVYDIGATNFPSIYLNTDHGAKQVTKGYFELDQLEQRLLQVLESA